MSYMRAPEHLVKEARWRKERALEWFHKITSDLNEAQIVLLCIEHGISLEGKTMHAMQTALLGCGPG